MKLPPKHCIRIWFLELTPPYTLRRLGGDFTGRYWIDRAENPKYDLIWNDKTQVIRGWDGKSVEIRKVVPKSAQHTVE